MGHGNLNSGGSGAGDDVRWFVRAAGQDTGPFTTDQLMEIASQGGVTPRDLVRTDGSPIGLSQAKSPDSSRPRRWSGPARNSLPEAAQHANAAEVARDSLAHIHQRRLNAVAQEKPKLSKSAAVSDQLKIFKEYVGAFWEGILSLGNRALDLLRQAVASRVTLAVIAVVLVAVLISKISFHWSSAPEAPYPLYVALLAEFEEFRLRDASDAEWKDFVQRAESRLAPVVADLESNVDVRDHAKLSLLRIGRDYLPLMLMDARDAPSESEKNMRSHMQAVAFFARQDEQEPAVSITAILMTGFLIIDVIIIVLAIVWMTRFVRRHTRANYG